MLNILRSTLVICTAVSLVSISAHAHAQGSLREQTSSPAGDTPRQIISVNPFMPLAGYFQAEYERGVQENVSFAVSASLSNFDNRRYRNADVKLRFYPQDRVLEGLGFAVGVGVGSARADDELGACAPIDCVPPVFPGKYRTAPTFSVEGHHQWLLGRSRATAVTVGGGIKRYFFGRDEPAGVRSFAPTGRLTIGWAFR